MAEAGTPREAASVSMVGVSGVGMSSAAGTSEASTGFNSYVIASVLAAKSQFGQSAKVSSPASAGARNSSDLEPPIAPAVAAQMR